MVYVYIHISLYIFRIKMADWLTVIGALRKGMESPPWCLESGFYTRHARHCIAASFQILKFAQSNGLSFLQ